MQTAIADIFEGRKSSCQEGFLAFFDGVQDNPYPENRSDHDFIYRREWQSGYDMAYLFNQEAVQEDERRRTLEVLQGLDGASPVETIVVAEEDFAPVPDPVWGAV